MTTLIFTYYVVAYLLIPAALFRFAASLFITLRQLQRTRTQEFVFAVGAALLPFVAAWVLVAAGWGYWPLPVEAPTWTRWRDYQLLYQGVVSDRVFQSQATADQFWSAVARVCRRQVDFLSFYWAFTVIEAGAFAWLIRQYPRWKLNRIYSYIAEKALLKHVSEWTMLLTPTLSLGSDPEREVWLDALSRDGTLYRGLLGDFFLDENGALTGFVLGRRETDPSSARRVPTHRSPLRFDRERYKQARDRDPEGVKRDDFWREIPSGAFYIPYEQVLNLNVSYEEVEPSHTLTEATRDLIDEGLEVLEIEDPESPPKP